MWLLLLLLGLTQAADERLVLRNGSNPCAGVPQVYYVDKWGFVGSSSLTDKEKSVACRSALCGDLQHSEELLRPHGNPSWMNQLQCQGDEQQLQKCNFSQWTMTASAPPTTSKITCSRETPETLTSDL
uniref:SRCR domain-containing protein n=1 Tax=Knipowitschia caucasica TaxID=637954 RepID=A0AAV2M1H6_KNICA